MRMLAEGKPCADKCEKTLADGARFKGSNYRTSGALITMLFEAPSARLVGTFTDTLQLFNMIYIWEQKAHMSKVCEHTYRLQLTAVLVWYDQQVYSIDHQLLICNVAFNAFKWA